MNKKGFTMVELLATIVILAILAVLAVVGVSTYLNHTYQVAYQDYEKTLSSASSNFLIENSIYTPEVQSSLVLEGDMLVCRDYMKTFQNPRNKENSCSAYVIVTRNEDVQFNQDIDFQVCLRCGQYESEACKMDVSQMKHITSSICEEPR